MFRRSFFLALVLLSVVPVLAQQPDLKQAQEAFSKGDYRSRSSFTRRSQKPILTTPTPGNASDSPIKQARSMIWLPALLKRPLKEGFTPGGGKYNLACAYARLGRTDDSIRLLTELVDQRWPVAVQMAGDNDLASLRGDSRFAPLAERAKFIVEPCRDAKNNPEFRQLDFWVGEWNVFSGSQKVGDSSVQLILKDCVVFENWTSTLGRSGKSFNKYDPANKYWQQFWVADNGSTTLYTGHLEDGEMRYHAELPAPNGGKLLQNLTFFKLEQGKVRQFQQFSTDGGKTWNTGYDFVYVHKNAD